MYLIKRHKELFYKLPFIKLIFEIFLPKRESQKNLRSEYLYSENISRYTYTDTCVYSCIICMLCVCIYVKAYISLSKLISPLEKHFNPYATLIFKLPSPSGVPEAEKIETSAYNNN